MKYKVRVRRYETVIRDVVMEVEARGRQQARQIAEARATVLPVVEWGPAQEGFDIKFDSEVGS